MSSFLLFQQCPTCLLRLIWKVYVMGGRWPYSCCYHDVWIRNDLNKGLITNDLNKWPTNDLCIPSTRIFLPVDWLGYYLPIGLSLFVKWHVNLCRLFKAMPFSWSYLTHSWEHKGVYMFLKDICPKVNEIARVEFELAYHDSASHRFND